MFLNSFCFSQNWRGVNPTDTAYYQSISKNYNASNRIEMSICSQYLMQTVFCDTFYIQNSIENYIFFKSCIYNLDSFCVDTNAASRLVKAMYRDNLGNEKYITEFYDTLLFQTQAPLAYSWAIHILANGNYLKGTIINLDTVIIDQNVDSIKTIVVELYNYSNQKLGNIDTCILSKNYGWYALPRIWRYTPNAIAYNNPWNLYQNNDIDKLFKLKAQLPKFVFGNNKYERYKPGNVVETYYTDEFRNPNVWNLTYDSIISLNIINSDTLIADHRIIKYINNIEYDTTISKIHIKNNQNLINYFNGDTKFRTNINGGKIQLTSYLSDEIPKHIFYESPYALTMNSHFCFEYNLPLSIIIRNTMIVHENIGVEFLIENYNEHTLQKLYYRINGIEYGDYISILDVKNISINEIKIYPNPTGKILILDLPNEKNICYKIYNTLGSIVKQGTLANNEINVEALAPTFYILELQGKEKIYKGKFIKE